MPQIVEYNAPEGLGLRPTETGIESVAGAARRVQGAYNEAAELKSSTGQRIGSAISVAGGEATRYATHQQISQGAAAFSGINAGYTQKWDELHKNADVANPAIGQSFLQSLEGDLEKFKSGFLTEEGQQWAEHHAEQLRNHFTQKVIADRSTAEGHAIATQTAQAFNGASTSVFIDPSEDNLRFNLDTLRGHTGDVVGTSGLGANDKIEVGGKLTQKAGEALIKSAAQGYIKQYGVLPPYLSKEKYKGFVNEPELRQLEAQEKSQQRANDVMARQQEKLIKDQQKQDVSDAESDAHNNYSHYNSDTQTTDFDKGYTDASEKIRLMPGGKKTADAMIAKVESEVRRRDVPIRTDPNVYSDLIERMVTPSDNPTTKLQILEAHNHLSSADSHYLNALHTEITKAPMRDPILKASLDAVKGLLGTDPIGKEGYKGFLQQFTQQYLQLPLAERPGALDFNNPNSLIKKVYGPLERDLAAKTIDKLLGEQPAATGGFKPPPGSKTNAARPGQVMFPDGSIHDLNTGALIPPAPRAMPVVPASQ